jgi:hypothetical protein
MVISPLPAPVSLESERERIVEQLSAHYAEDHLTTQELESRFERAYRATTAGELASVVSGLPALAQPVRNPVPRASAAPIARPADGMPERRYLAIMSNFRKGGDWTPQPRTTIRAIMADVKIDLRDATFMDRVVEFDILAVMADATILVPPGVRVECDGFAVMGEFSDRHDASGGDADAPLVRIRGTSVMASVKVQTRLPGETKLAAWRRTRLERGARED